MTRLFDRIKAASAPAQTLRCIDTPKGQAFVVVETVETPTPPVETPVRSPAPIGPRSTGGKGREAARAPNNPNAADGPSDRPSRQPRRQKGDVKPASRSADRHKDAKAHSAKTAARARAKRAAAKGAQ